MYVYFMCECMKIIVLYHVLKQILRIHKYKNSFYNTIYF
jgi:hypothetical protein